MSVSPRTLYTAAQVRELDRRAIEGMTPDHGGDPEAAGYALMARAGAAAFRLLQLRWTGARRLAIYCGGGNNGGDGLVVAALARAAGLEVQVGLARDPSELGGAAARAWADWAAAGGDHVPLEQVDAGAADVVVDALLGTGLDRPVGGAIASAIERINGAGRPVLALDIPSGLQTDSGAVLGDAVRAAATITFIGAKRGLYTGAAPDYTGPVFADALDVPEAIRADIGAITRALDEDWVAQRLPRRRPTAHKGDCGRILIVGGDHGFAGAVRLAGEAALRSGAGLVTVATRPQHAAVMASARPELMTRAMDDPARELPAWLDEADVVVAGPGLGRGDWGQAALTAVLAQAGQRRVLDADALNLLATAPTALGADTVLTPHPGEAGRLLGVSAMDVQADRYSALAQLIERYDASVLLKGPGSLIGAPGAGIRMVAGAQPALAVGGMGDVLSGVIAGLLGQGLAPPEAAACGAWLHAAAATRCAAADGVNGVLPSDLMPALATVIRDAAVG